MKNLKIMSRIKLTFIQLLFGLLIWGLGSFAQAQQNNTLYFMEMIPQANQMNPAFQNKSILYLGMPGLSSFHTSVNTGLGFNDIIYYDEENDRPVTFLYKEEYQDNFLKTMDRAGSLLAFEHFQTIGSFGFKVRDLYFSWDASLRNEFETNLPADIPRLLLNGNYIDGEPQNYSFNDLNFSMNSFMETGIGVSYKVDHRLTLGIKPKLLFGIGNVSTSDVSAHLNSVDSLHLNADITLNGAAAGMTINEGDDFMGDIEFADEPSVMIDDIMQNKGFAVDMGATYRLNKRINLSASLTDLGWISWKGGANKVSLDADYTFTGADASSVFDEDDTTEVFSNLTDTLNDVFSLTEELGGDHSYNTNLHGKLYLGGTYTPMKGIKLGLLSRTSMVNKNLRQQVTLSANFHPINMLNASFSYTIKNYTFNNLGFGLGLKAGPFNFYLVSDNIPLVYDKLILDGSTIPLPHNFKAVNIRMGFNLMFGYKGRIDAPIFNPRAVPDFD